MRTKKTPPLALGDQGRRGRVGGDPPLPLSAPRRPSGAASPYLPLRRDFVIGITASLALLVAMAVFWIRLQSYLRGRRLAELLSHLLQVITTFATSGELADDWTALAIRCRRSLFPATPRIRD